MTCYQNYTNAALALSAMLYLSGMANPVAGMLFLGCTGVNILRKNNSSEQTTETTPVKTIVNSQPYLLGNFALHLYACAMLSSAVLTTPALVVIGLTFLAELARAILGDARGKRQDEVFAEVLELQ